jgi:hypothetical protein
MGDEIMRELRERLLTTDPGSLALEPSERLPRVWGALMEMGTAGGTASLVAVADGTTSLYLSTGGGIIGGGEHAAVVEASTAFLEAVESRLDQLAPAAEAVLPEPGAVRFTALTYQGLHSGGAAEDALGAGTHPLSALFVAGHDVLTQLRLIAG